MVIAMSIMNTTSALTNTPSPMERGRKLVAVSIGGGEDEVTLTAIDGWTDVIVGNITNGWTDVIVGDITNGWTDVGDRMVIDAITPETIVSDVDGKTLVDGIDVQEEAGMQYTVVDGIDGIDDSSAIGINNDPSVDTINCDCVVTNGVK